MEINFSKQVTQFIIVPDTPVFQKGPKLFPKNYFKKFPIKNTEPRWNVKELQRAISNFKLYIIAVLDETTRTLSALISFKGNYKNRRIFQQQKLGDVIWMGVLIITHSPNTLTSPSYSSSGCRKPADINATTMQSKEIYFSIPLLFVVGQQRIMSRWF